MESTESGATLLLTIPRVSVTQIYQGESVPLSTGDLELSLIAAEPDNYLVLKVKDVEVVLTSESHIFKKGEHGLYVPWLELPGAVLLFDLAASTRELSETLDTFLVDFTSMPAPEPSLRNQLALVDENGQVVGEVEIDNKADLARPIFERTASSKEPVMVDLAQNGELTVEKYKGSKIVEGGTHISSGILYGAEYLSSSIEKGSEWLNSRSAPAEKDVEFSAITKAGTRRIHQLSTGVSHVSSKTLGYVSTLAEKAGGKVSGHIKIGDGKSKDPTKKPGILSQSAFAIVSILDAVDKGGRQLLGSASDNIEKVVQHRYGSQAGTMAQELGGSVKNVALVYFDAQGVSHRALLTGSIKGGIKARMSDGSRVVLDDKSVHTKTD